MHVSAPAQVGQAKGRAAVAAVVVPGSKKAPWFWLIGRNCPSQKAVLRRKFS